MRYSHSSPDLSAENSIRSRLNPSSMPGTTRYRKDLGHGRVVRDELIEVTRNSAHSAGDRARREMFASISSDTDQVVQDQGYLERSAVYQGGGHESFALDGKRHADTWRRSPAGS